MFKMQIQERIEELEKEIAYFNKKYREWNNKSLDKDIREKAEKEVFRLVDSGKGVNDLSIELKGIMFCQEENKKKCAFDSCENESVMGIGNNLNKGSLRLCKKCFDLYDQHLTAREKMIKESTEEKVGKAIDGFDFDTVYCEGCEGSHEKGNFSCINAEAHENKIRELLKQKLGVK